MAINLPTIGDIVLSPHDKVLDALSGNKYDLLPCDGAAVSIGTHPTLYAIRTTKPTIVALDARVPYKIVGDLT